MTLVIVGRFGQCCDPGRDFSYYGQMCCDLVRIVRILLILRRILAMIVVSWWDFCERAGLL